jgi:triacylglycerol lipase
MAESIVLVPGLFGFGRVGDIDYFASVKPILANSSGVARIVALRTPPTGPLWRRVDHLYAKVRELIDEGSERVHIVGHSTGGVDARLLVDSRYLWPGGPYDAERQEFFDRIGAVVSLSAPHKGTPIATRLRGALEGVIPLLFLASFFAKYDVQSGADAGPVTRAWRRGALYRRIAGALLRGRPARYSATDATGLPADTARDLVALLDEIVDDHPLIHELTPYAMDRLNTHLNESATPGRVLTVTNFVSVAPPPALHASDLSLSSGVDPLMRAVYTGAYAETRLVPYAFGKLPAGPWIGKPDNFDDFATRAQDGVVPAASQTFDGHVEKYVFGDHLDVIGHYPSAKHGGETVFDSGADFDDSRLEDLWKAIGAVIVRSRPTRPLEASRFAAGPSLPRAPAA